jgi:hypothetical protein
MPRVAVNYVTFARDLEWTDYSLRSFRKYAKGFCGVTIVVPDRDLDAFLPYESRFSTPDCPVLVKNFKEMPEKGFVHHLAMKCYADVFQPDADFILHMDPDCLWSKPVTPESYFVGGKPVLVVEPYDAIYKADPQHCPRHYWKRVTEMALRFDCPYETMCRHPAIHYRETYRRTRDHIEKEHLTPFTDFVLKQQNKFPQGFGEFNTLGAYAMAKMHDQYHFIDRGYLGQANDPEPLLEQMWSYTGIHSPDNWDKIQRILQ